MLVLVADVTFVHQMPLSELPETPKNTNVGAELSAQGQVKVSVPASVSLAMTRAAPPDFDSFGVCVSISLLLCCRSLFCVLQMPLSQLPGGPKNTKVGAELSAQGQVKVLVPAAVRAEVTRASDAN